MWKEQRPETFLLALCYGIFLDTVIDDSENRIKIRKYTIKKVPKILWWYTCLHQVGYGCCWVWCDYKFEIMCQRKYYSLVLKKIIKGYNNSILVSNFGIWTFQCSYYWKAIKRNKKKEATRRNSQDFLCNNKFLDLFICFTQLLFSLFLWCC